ncbi:hypothetical protein HYV83_04620 [Candidatus Woesearchaeota archaeon]|nr:hypothetical protein [Candidatus Woesearchaeota archaeon]
MVTTEWFHKSKKSAVSKNVVKTDDSYWHWYTRISKSEPKITGKYLFFSKQKEELEKIAVEELENGEFFLAKLNKKQHKKGTNYVLCLYFRDDSRKKELARKYGNSSKIQYRYWKSDEDTFKGKYSEQFLATLSPEEKKIWTKGAT